MSGDITLIVEGPDTAITVQSEAAQPVEVVTGEIAGTAARIMAAHLAEADPHPQYLTEADAGGRFAAADHAHATATAGESGFMSSADKAKLDGIQPGATANATDAQLRDRSTHTGTQPIASVAGLQAALDAKLDAARVGAADGVAPLGPDLKVPAAYLPAYVDDVLEFASVAAFPATGEAGKIYVARNAGTPADPSRAYRWSGSAYIEISPSPGSTDAVPEGAANLYFTDARARAALAADLAGKADASHSHTFASLAGKPTTLAGYGITDAIAASQRGAANGVAPLGADGKVPAEYLAATGGGAVDDAIVNGVTDRAPSQNAVFDALAGKADLSGASFTGAISSGGAIQSMGGSVVSRAAAGGNAHFWLRDETGKNEGLLYWDRGTDTVFLRRYAADGATVEGQLSIKATVLEWNGQAVFHAGSPPTFAQITSKPTTLAGYGITDAAPSSHVGSGGGAHANATASASGFMSASDKSKLDGIAAGATNTPLASTAPAALGASASAGTSTSAARADHVHPRPTAAEIGAFPATGGTITGNVTVNGSVTVAGGANAYYFPDRTSGRQWAWWAQSDTALLWNGSGSPVSISPTGAISAASFDTGSSERLKTDLRPIPYGLAELERIAPMVGRYRPEFGAGDRQRLFLIAEQIAGVVPEVVRESAVEFDGERLPAVDYMQLVPVLIRAVQELAEARRADRAELEALRARVAELSAGGAA